ncbi:MAG: DUF3794 domain-containing protein [Clostridia bacterium]
MSVNTERKKIKLNMSCINENISKWIEQDIIVPDTKPDAIKIINVTVNPYVTDTEPLDSKIKVMGKLNYFIIYKVNDEKFTTRGLSVSYPFTEILDVKGADKDSFVIINPITKNIIHSLPNERKMAIKAEIMFKVKARNSKEVNIITGFDEDVNIEKKMCTDKFDNIIENKKSIIASKENVMIPKEADDIYEILNVTNKIKNTEFKESYNKIMLKGDIDINVVYLSDEEGESVKKFNVLIPFSAMVDFENIKDISKFNMNYMTRDLNLSVNPDTTSKTMNIDYQIEADITMYEELEENYVEDFYSQNKELEYTNRKVDLVKKDIIFEKAIDIKENITNILPQNTKVVEYFLDTNYIIPKVTNNNVNLEGNAKITLILQNVETMEIDTKVIEILINENFEVDKIYNNAVVNIDIIDERAIVTQNGTDIEVKIVLKINNHIEDISKLNIVEEIEETPIDGSSIDSINIYIVKAGDTLWNIARKYKTSVEKIVKTNDIQNPDVISVGQKILIIR